MYNVKKERERGGEGREEEERLVAAGPVPRAAGDAHRTTLGLTVNSQSSSRWILGLSFTLPLLFFHTFFFSSLLSTHDRSSDRLLSPRIPRVPFANIIPRPAASRYFVPIYTYSLGDRSTELTHCRRAFTLAALLYRLYRIHARSP